MAERLGHFQIPRWRGTIAHEPIRSHGFNIAGKEATLLANKNVVLGVTGGIAAYKVVDVARKLTLDGATVDVIMTESATKFIAPLTFQTLTRRPVVTDMFQLLSDMNIGHVALAERADVIAIAPATANTIAKLAHGLCDDMLSTTVLATRAPVVLAPAMNYNMYENVVTQENLARLRHRGFFIVEPTHGTLASGAIGQGRLAETEDILGAIAMALGRKGDLAGLHIVVTAGGTQEPIDPVRHITNRSSGKMGYAIAEAARDRGAATTLISGPTALRCPYGVQFHSVETALEMKDAVDQAVVGADALIMAAAVADYRVEQPAEHKIKKGEGEGLTLRLTRNPDILGGLPDSGVVKVGFAAESEDLLAMAEHKLKAKRLDMIVANSIVGPHSAFGSDVNKVWFLEAGGLVTELPMLPKSEVAGRILDKVRDLVARR